MTSNRQADPPISPVVPAAVPTSRCIDWYAEGESKVVEVNGARIVVRFVGRRGRRGRIAIEAPAGAAFSTLDDGEKSKMKVR